MSERWLQRVIILLGMLVAFASGQWHAGASALEAPISDLLPQPEALGDGWTVTQSGILQLPAEAFREGVSAVYAGPAGARVIVLAMRETTERVAVRRSWEEALTLFERASRETAHHRDQDAFLATLPPPHGCLEAKRVEGTVKSVGLDTGIPAGVTLCAAGGGVIVLVAASGPVLGMTGHAAADAVIEQILSGQPAAMLAAGERHDA
ncbi:MAG: hypothetical protein C4346_06165 [Chloroflexota bacterium]